MKFEVTTHPYDNSVEVRLHDDTKDKIKKIFTWTVSIGFLAGSIVLVRRDNKRIEKETPTE